MCRKCLYIVIFFILEAFPSGFAGEDKSPEKVDWHAYTQLRFATDLKENYNLKSRQTETKVQFLASENPAHLKRVAKKWLNLRSE